MSRAASPIVKWAGGKTRLLDELIARVPPAFGRYYEPFAGGAALFFRLAPARALLTDANAALIGMYHAVRDEVDGVIRNLRRHQKAHGKDYYYRVRARWNRGRFAPGPARAAAFIYLNKTCFNGLYRVNRDGEFNVPMGRYTDPTICDPEALRFAHSMLAGVEIRCARYEGVVATASRGDFVYFDPPYAPLTPTANFTSYTAEKFGVDDQRALARLARRLAARGCHVMLSNSDTPLVRELYDGFQIDRVRCARSINSDAAKRRGIYEVIITGGAR